MTCDEGYRQRAKKTMCQSKLPRDVVRPPSETPQFDNCASDADCTERPHGYCELSMGQITGYRCRYGCVTDDDCSPGTVCECGDPVGSCVPASCTENADCGPGLACASYVADPGCDHPAFACQDPRDECLTSADCAEGKKCTVGKDKYRVCQGETCVVGRPFLVLGEERTARTIARGGWSESERTPEVSDLSQETRERLSEAWSAIGRMEHASIAAFARFALELLAYGAPADLVADASSAMADETLHARLAYGLASAYAGQRLGPAELRVDGSLDGLALDTSVVTAFLEGCIGETVAALEATEALAVATDAAVRAVLARVADDEARHAELAWRFVQWALPRARSDIRGRLRAELDAALRASSAADVEPKTEAPALLAHGVLPTGQRARLRAAALREVVAPCLEALLNDASERRWVASEAAST